MAEEARRLFPQAGRRGILTGCGGCAGRRPNSTSRAQFASHYRSWEYAPSKGEGKGGFLYALHWYRLRHKQLGGGQLPVRPGGGDPQSRRTALDAVHRHHAPSCHLRLLRKRKASRPLPAVGDAKPAKFDPEQLGPRKVRAALDFFETLAGDSRISRRSVADRAPGFASAATDRPAARRSRPYLRPDRW